MIVILSIRVWYNLLARPLGYYVKVVIRSVFIIVCMYVCISLSLYIYIYIYMYIDLFIYAHLSLSLSISLSLSFSIYIYIIYIHTHTYILVCTPSDLHRRWEGWERWSRTANHALSLPLVGSTGKEEQTTPWRRSCVICGQTTHTRSVFIISNRKISNLASQILKTSMLLMCPYCLKFQIARV